MKRKVLISMICLILIIVTVHNFDQHKEQKITLEEVVEAINQEHREKLESPPLYSQEEFLPFENQSEHEGEFTEDEMMLLFQQGENQEVSKEEAIEDTEMLFRIFKEAYPAYSFFGGEKVFLEAKQSIMKAIDGIKENSISAETLTSVFLEHLSFIEDSHLAINKKHIPFLEKYCYYAVECQGIRKEKSGHYYIEWQGERWYLEQGLDSYLKYTISPDGEIIYGMFAVANIEEKEQLPVEIKLHHKHKEKIMAIHWEVSNTGLPSTIKNKQQYTNEEIEGIPIISISKMSMDEATDEFIDDAKKLKDKAAIILDLRHCHGGIEVASMMWLYNLTEEIISAKEIQCYRESELNRKSHERSVGDRSLYSLQFMDEYPKVVTEMVNIRYGEKIAAKWRERKPLLIVLIDKEVYSAGEDFLRELKTVSNVVLVGTNSNGCLLTGSTNPGGEIYLPNSKVSLYLPTTLIIADDMADYEARGTLPDIYIRNEDALEAALRSYKFKSP